MNSLRRFTSLCISFTFLIMSFTGIVLFFAPKGRVANAIDWEILGLEKTDYAHLHVTFMVLFLIGIFFHSYLNWHALFSYLFTRAKTFSLLTKEFIVALLLNLFFLFGTLYYWVPFEHFLDFQESLKASWAKPVAKASIPLESTYPSDGKGYGKLTLKEASLHHTFAFQNAVQLLHEKGVDANEHSTLKEISESLHVKPIELLELLKSTSKKESK